MGTLDQGAWRKSSYSGTNGNCVEVGAATSTVLVRDTKDRDGVSLEISPAAWRHFTTSVK